MNGRGTRIAAWLTALALAFAIEGADAAPAHRVVSINVCTDALLADLLPRERIIAVSHLGLDPHFSPRARELQGLTAIRGDADEVLALDPDLVVGGKHAARATVALLERLGIPVLTLELADSVATARVQILRLADALGERERGDRAVARLDRAIAHAARHLASRYPGSVSAANGTRPRVLLLRPNGFTAGPDTLEGDVLRLAGLHNLAGELGIRTWGSLDLEQLVATRVDVLLTDHLPHAPSQAGVLLSHRALGASGARPRTAAFATNLFTCPGPWLGDAVLALLPLHSGDGASR